MSTPIRSAEEYKRNEEIVIAVQFTDKNNLPEGVTKSDGYEGEEFLYGWEDIEIGDWIITPKFHGRAVVDDETFKNEYHQFKALPQVTEGEVKAWVKKYMTDFDDSYIHKWDIEVAILAAIKWLQSRLQSSLPDGGGEKKEEENDYIFSSPDSLGEKDPIWIPIPKQQEEKPNDKMAKAISKTINFIEDIECSGNKNWGNLRKVKEILFDAISNSNPTPKQPEGEEQKDDGSLLFKWCKVLETHNKKLKEELTELKANHTGVADVLRELIKIVKRLGFEHEYPETLKQANEALQSLTQPK